MKSARILNFILDERSVTVLFSVRVINTHSPIENSSNFLLKCISKDEVLLWDNITNDALLSCQALSAKVGNVLPN